MLQINPNRLVIIKTDERESQIGKVKKTNYRNVL